MTESDEDIQNNKDLAAVSYVWILGIVMYFSRKDSPFIQFHSKQSSVLFVFSLLLWPIPYIGGVLEIFVLAGMIIGFLNAAQGLYYRLPFVYSIASGQFDFEASIKSLANSVRYAINVIKRVFHNKDDHTNGRH